MRQEITKEVIRHHLHNSIVFGGWKREHFRISREANATYMKAIIQDTWKRSLTQIEESAIWLLLDIEVERAIKVYKL